MSVKSSVELDRDEKVKLQLLIADWSENGLFEKFDDMLSSTGIDDSKINKLIHLAALNQVLTGEDAEEFLQHILEIPGLKCE